MSSLTLEKTVGSMKNPFKPRALPPHSSLAPSWIPLWIYSSTRFWCSRLICRRKKWNFIDEIDEKKKNQSHTLLGLSHVCWPHLRTLLSRGVKRAADYPPLCSLHTPANKLIINGLLHKDARACSATLACIEKHTLVGLLHCQVHLGRKKVIVVNQYVGKAVYILIETTMF